MSMPGGGRETATLRQLLPETEEEGRDRPRGDRHFLHVCVMFIHTYEH